MVKAFLIIFIYTFVSTETGNSIFMINLIENLPVTDGDIVHWDLITQDNGGNYNPDTGAYTAPYTGTYT